MINKNLTLVSFILTTVSALAAGIRQPDEMETPAFAPGVSVLSSSGDGNSTAIAGLGHASYTKTGDCSATSLDNQGTLTNDCHDFTGYSTTHEG